MVPTRTFFFRLNAHQATIVIAVFQFILYFLEFVAVCLLGIWLSLSESRNPSHKVKDEMNGVDLFTTFIQVASLICMFFMACAVRAVLFRKRCLVVPFIVMQGLEVVAYIFGLFKALEEVTKERTFQVMAILMVAVFFFSLIGMKCYFLLAAVICFQEMGAANQDTQYRNSAINVPLQQFVPNQSREFV